MFLAIHCNFRNWHQLFYNRSGSYKVHALQFSITLFIASMEISLIFKKRTQPNFNPFSPTGEISRSIGVRKGW